MTRLLAAVFALACAQLAHAGAYEGNAFPYLHQLATKSVNGNVPRGLNPDPHFITIDPGEWYDIEQAAVSGYSLSTRADRVPVGGAFRGYAGNGPGWVFGWDAEAITSADSNAHVIGGEIDVIARNADSTSEKRALHLIFFDRLVGPEAPAESGLGQNRYNQNAKAIVVESLPRSVAGEYSGWNSVITLADNALDRTLDKPYAQVIDMSVSNAGAPEEVPVYVFTYRCGQSRCGLKATILGLELWETIDTRPRLVRIL